MQQENELITVQMPRKMLVKLLDDVVLTRTSLDSWWSDKNKLECFHILQKALEPKQEQA